MSQYGLNKYDAGVLTSSREIADYYEAVIKEAKADPKIAANWIAVELSGFLNRDNKDITQSTVTAPMMAGGSSNASPTTPSPARLPRMCSKLCGPAKAMLTP